MSDRARLWVWFTLVGVSSYMVAYFFDRKYPLSYPDTTAVVLLAAVWIVAARGSYLLWTQKNH